MERRQLSVNAPAFEPELPAQVLMYRALGLALCLVMPSQDELKRQSDKVQLQFSNFSYRQMVASTDLYT
eukprot:s382_g34.t1